MTEGIRKLLDAKDARIRELEAEIEWWAIQDSRSGNRIGELEAEVEKLSGEIKKLRERS